jgi:hypothetical protein
VELAEKSYLKTATGAMAASRLYTELNSGFAGRAEGSAAQDKTGIKNMSILSKCN